MATINGKIADWLDGITGVSDVEPQNRFDQNGYVEAVYWRTGANFVPNHDCNTLDTGVFRIEFISDKHDEVVTAAEEARDDLKAGSGAIDYNPLKVHLPEDYGESPMALSAIDDNEYMAFIRLRAMT